jgi:hypothetical protein
MPCAGGAACIPHWVASMEKFLILLLGFKTFLAAAAILVLAFKRRQARLISDLID